ncbi:MAG TPA: alpha/beta hydrolase [Solirubrobacteraceae bacterium]|nr:alpha/beta hydrolase [Solirubrobacteraceae bacterium]
MREQLAINLRNAVRRQGADETYADADDAGWLGVDWAALQRPVEVFGHRVNVLDTGGDRPVILWIHGLSANWQSWLLNIPQFMGTYRCVALDLPGFGASEMPSDEITISGYARTVDAVCQALGIRAASVVGHSMGGFVGCELALQFPTRVERLVLVSAAGLSQENVRREPVLAVGRMLAAGAAQVTAYQDTLVRRPRLRRLALAAVARYPERLSAALTRELFQGAGKPGFMPALEALMAYSYRDRLGQIEVPVLVVWGEYDMLVPVQDAGEYARLIGANARKVVFADTGHAPSFERPTRFNALLAEFLAGERLPEAGVEGVSAS